MKSPCENSYFKINRMINSLCNSQVKSSGSPVTVQSSNSQVIVKHPAKVSLALTLSQGFLIVALGHD